MEKKNNENNTLKKGKRVKTSAGITVASMLTGFVVGGTILLNVGTAENTVNSKNIEDTENVAEEFKYKGEDEGSILNIQEELAKIDREETKRRQEEFKKQLAEQKQEEERLEEEERVKEEEAQIVAEQQAQQQAQQQAPKQSTQTPKQNTQAPKQSTQAPKQSTQAPKPAPKPASKPAPKPEPQPSTKPQQTESDPEYPVEGDGLGGKDGNRGDGDKETIDWKEDELHDNGYTQNGVEGVQR